MNRALLQKVRQTVRAVAVLAGAAGLVAQAQGTSSAVAVYRCPGPPVLYTDAITAQQAKERGCRTIEGTPITVVQGVRPKPPASANAAVPPGTGSAARSGEGRIDPAAQRARDTDSKRILESELRRDEERLAALQKDFNNGEPERRGDERNAQKYVDRIAEMKLAISRKEADNAALRRELNKLP